MPRSTAVCLLLVLALPGPLSATTAVDENFNRVIAGYPVILYGSDMDYARSVQSSLRLTTAVSMDVVSAAEAGDSLLAKHDIIAFGTAEDNPFVAKCLGRAPFKLSDTSIEIDGISYAGDDIRVAFAVTNPYNTQRTCVVFAAQKPDLISGIISGFGDWADWDFMVNRKSDGTVYADDKVAAGRYHMIDSMAVIDTLAVWKRDPEQLSRIDSGHVSLHYNTLSESQATTIVQLLDALYDGIAVEYGVAFPDKVTAYIYLAPPDDRKYYCYTDAISTFWYKIGTSREQGLEGFLSPDNEAVLIFAHEMARMAFQPSITDPAKYQPFSTNADDWSHYFQFTCLIPYVWEKLGEDAWPVKHDYNQSSGRNQFETIYAGCDNTYAALLYEIGRNYGRDVICRLANEAKGGKA
jgi:hypothetical protein